MSRLCWLGVLGWAAFVSLAAFGQARDTRLELVPPSPITDKVVIDIRGAIENHSGHNRRYTASLYLDRKAPANLLHTASLEIASGSNGRISYRQPTAGWAGKRRVILEVASPDSESRAEQDLDVLPSGIRSTRTIDGAWLGIVHWSDEEGRYWNTDIRKLTDDDWRQQIRGMHGIGMDTVVIQELFRNQEYYGRYSISKTGYKGLAYYPSALFPGRMQIASHDPVEAILAEADLLHMNVFLGVGMYAWFDFSAASLDWHKKVAEELWRRYGHHPSFYGWYVSEEVYGSLIPDQGEAVKDRYRQEIVTFFREFQSFCRKLAPEKPVMLAPNAHGMRQSQDAWPLVLQHLDIVCPFAFHRMPRGDVTGDESATIWQGMCDRAGSHLWMDMEAFLFEGKALVPRPIDGLIQDLTRFPNFEKILCYQYPGIFNSPDSSLKPGGPRTVMLYSEYQQYLKSLHRKAEGR
ncbi:MAG TPA: DUF4434 domain-containing protein [Bryobacteraceae bacterium]|nr:DUF4434 domain-containing protein [Bryobacteraceae bacterium]